MVKTKLNKKIKNKNKINIFFILIDLKNNFKLNDEEGET